MNVLIISGHVGGDAELRYTKGGTAVCSFSVPATAGFGDNKTTTWVKCNLWGKRAERLAEFLTKGAPVVVSGEFSVREWEDKNGTTQKSPEMNVNDVTLMGKKSTPGAATGGQQEKAEPPPTGFDDESLPF